MLGIFLLATLGSSIPAADINKICASAQVDALPEDRRKRYEVASATRPRPGIRSNGSGIDLLRPIGAIAPRRQER